MPGISKENREVLKNAGFENVTQKGSGETWVKAWANGDTHFACTCKPAGRKLGWVQVRTDVLKDTGHQLEETSTTEVVKNLQEVL